MKNFSSIGLLDKNSAIELGLKSMGESGEFIGAPPEAMIEGRENVVSLVEKRAERERKRKPPPENLGRALAKLREGSAESVTMHEAHTLVQAEMFDLQERQDPGEPDSDEVENLRKLDTAIYAISKGEIDTIEYATIKKLRDYLQGHMDKWNRTPNGMGTPENRKNYKIYAAVLSDINSHLPTAESILPELPEINAALLEPSLRPLLQKGELTITDLEKLYGSFAEAVRASNKQAEKQHPRWFAQREAVNTAVKQWDDVAIEKRKPLLVTVKDGKITAQEIEPEGKLPAASEGVTEFFLDPHNEGDTGYIQAINLFEKMEQLLPSGKEGIAKLKKGDFTLTPSEMGGLILLIGQIENGFDSGALDKKYIQVFQKLGAFVRSQFAKGTPPTEPETAQEEDSGAKVHSIEDARKRKFTRNGRPMTSGRQRDAA